MDDISSSPAILPSLNHGISVLNDRLQAIPHRPGVYRMLGACGEVLYVGKARNLFHRVGQYRQVQRLPYRIQHMVALLHEVVTYTTDNEAEALLLEANLIKEHRPPFNILLKDDKSYPYILVTKDHPFPRITKHRGKQTESGYYYGPFASSTAVNQAIIDLQKAFLVRPCTDSYFASRTRPCIEYQIKRCSAPCVHKISQADYGTLVTELNQFLSGKNRQLQEELQKQMQEYSEAMNYEKATIARDRIKALNHIQLKNTIHIDSFHDADVFGYAEQDGFICIELCLFRNHQHGGNRSYFFPRDDQEIPEMFAHFLAQFYLDHPAPSTILLPFSPPQHETLQTALSTISGHNVTLHIPQRGEQRQLMDSANYNAEQSLRQYRVKQLKRSHSLEQLVKLFSLPAPLERIEVYDNSHISGTHRVGAMVVVTPSGFDKASYRTFTIKTQALSDAGGDDYAMLREVLTRRLTRLLKEYPTKTPGIWPDLLLIDGGAGQLSSALSVLDALQLRTHIPVICIAKGKDRNAGRERFFVDGKEPFTLPQGDATLHYLQTLRDEVHRYAITTHRKKRQKSMSHSLLNDIPSIGNKRKQALLQHFGSVDAITNASIKELMLVKGISQHIAHVIYRFLHPE